jgi:aspartyl protease family protein
MKKTFIIQILFFFSLTVHSQSLTPRETINYLNKLSLENPSAPFKSFNCMAEHYKKYDLKKDGTFIIENFIRYFDCKSSKNTTKMTNSKSIHISDINIEEIKIDTKYEFLTGNRSIKIPCKMGNCILKEQGGKPREMHPYEKSKITIFERTNYILTKTYNALVYLLKTAYESGDYKRLDSDDPFAPPNFKDPRYKVESSSNITVITLSQEQGVFTLTVYFGNGAVKRKFILDSGASELAISKDLENELIINGLIRKENYLTPGLYQLADGSIISLRRVSIPKLKVGGFTVYNVTASIGNSNSPLLLGRSFLDKFKKWSIDNNSNKLILEK